MIPKLFDLSGRTALITGGSRGIGKACARALAECGADVAICARHESELAQAREEIAAGLDVRVEFFVTDMSDRASVKALADAVLAAFGRCDILFNNAGRSLPQSLVETTEASWDQTIELNLTSGLLLSRALVPSMIERRWGRIIYSSSIMGLASSPRRGSYSATKAALMGLARAQALELGPHGITVNCLAPGPVSTDLLTKALTAAELDQFAARTALKRWGQPIDIAGPLLLLASDAGAFVTGSTLVVDGGVLCRTFE